MKENPSYYAIIPANVRYDQKLCPNAKLLYGEITALCNKKGICWASNGYFAELYAVSKTSISKWITQLKYAGYIYTETKYKEAGKEIEHRYITIVRGEGIEEKLKGYITKVKGGIEEKLKDNITSINNTINKEILSGKPDVAPTHEKDDIPYEEIITYLNKTCLCNFRTTTSATRRLIKTRWREGFRLKDFKKVIDRKSSQWLTDNKMCDYLRPVTLFGTKFESYLNEVIE